MDEQASDVKRAEHLRLVSAIRQVFLDDQFQSGQILLAYLLKRCGVITPSLGTTDRDTHANAVRQSLILEILQLGQITEWQLTELITKNHQNYVRSRNLI